MGSAKAEQRKVRHWWLPNYEQFLVPALVAFVMGNMLVCALPGCPLGDGWITGCLLLILTGLVVAADQRWVIRLSLWWMAFLIGAFYFSWRMHWIDQADVAVLAPMASAQVEGMIVDHPSANPHRAWLQVTKINDKPGYHGQILVTTPSAQTLPESGAEVALTGRFELPRTALVPGEFDERAYLQSQNVSAVLRQASVTQVIFDQPTTLYGKTLRFLNETRLRMAGVFAGVMPSPDAEVLGSVVLGDKAIPVDSQTEHAFANTGLIHILAASGMNVAIVAAFVMAVLRFVPVSSEIRLMLSMLAVAFYSVLTGMPPSIQRSAAMLEMALILKLWNRQLSPLFLLCIAVAALVLLNPVLVGSLGFEFSVLTTFGIITMVPPLQDWLGRYVTKGLAGLILVPLIAQWWVMPLTLYDFNQFPLHSVPLNILALLFVAPLTNIGFTAGALSLLWAPLGQALTWVAWPLVKGLLWVVQTGYAMTWAKLTLPAPEPWLVMALYAVLLGSVLLLNACKAWPLRRKTLAFLLLLLLPVLPLWIEHETRLLQGEIAVVPLSGRAAAFVVTVPQSNQHVVLMPGDADYWEGRRLSDYLRHDNQQHLSALLLYGSAAQGTTAGVNAVLKYRQADRIVFLPPSGSTQASLGGVQINGGNGELFRLSLGRFCLSGLDSSTDAPPPGCSFVYWHGSDQQDYRLSPAGSLQPMRFYRLRPSGESLVVEGF